MGPDLFLRHPYQLSFKPLLYMMLYNLYSCKGIKQFILGLASIVIVIVATCLWT